MKNLVQIISKEGRNYVINVDNISRVLEVADGSMLISFVDTKVLYTTTTYNEFLKLTRLNNESKYNNPEEESFV